MACRPTYIPQDTVWLGLILLQLLVSTGAASNPASDRTSSPTASLSARNLPSLQLWPRPSELGVLSMDDFGNT